MDAAATLPLRRPEGLAQGRVIAVGHSHLTALQFAYAENHLATVAAIPPITFVQMLEPEFRRPDQGIDYARVAERLVAEQAEGDVFAALTCFSGNDYHVLSMVRSPRPFDFVLPGYEALPLQQGVQIVPFETVRQTIHAAIATAVEELATIRAALRCPFYVIAPPPPIFDGDYLNQPANAFWSKAESLGISPPEFRFKLWKIQSDIYAAGAQAMGATFVDPPAVALTQAGYMAERGWHPDGVHGSSWYGKQVLDQVFGTA